METPEPGVWDKSIADGRFLMDAKTALQVVDDLFVVLPVGEFEAFVQGVMTRCAKGLAESKLYHDLMLAAYEPPEFDVNDPRR